MKKINALLVVVTGLPATGKSSIARNLAKRLHGTFLSTDLIRKELLYRPRYTKEEKELIYAIMLLVARYLLRSDVTVVLDGTFYKRSLRKRVYAVAGRTKSNLKIIECVCPEYVIRRRMRRRAGRKRNLSDADYGVYKKVAAQFESIRRKHIVVDTSMFLKQNLEEIVHKIRKDRD
ncbi:MAG: AAA family ATPase [Candidatus Hydrothermarchaeota archaeon]|nr:AAA family ATPase [Candidatus Hydrothermarchaeota archaeon]